MFEKNKKKGANSRLQPIIKYKKKSQKSLCYFGGQIRFLALVSGMLGKRGTGGHMLPKEKSTFFMHCDHPCDFKMNLCLIHSSMLMYFVPSIKGAVGKARGCRLYICVHLRGLHMCQGRQGHRNSASSTGFLLPHGDLRPLAFHYHKVRDQQKHLLFSVIS